MPATFTHFPHLNSALKRACRARKTHAWHRPETAQFLRAQAHHLEYQGKPEEAIAKLAEADLLERKDEG